MEVVVRSGEREDRVTVRRAGDGYDVAVGERLYRVDHAAAGGLQPGHPTGLHSLRIDGAQHEVAVCWLGGGSYQVTAGGVAARVEVADPLAHLAAQGLAGQASRGRRRVTAYMPGRVVDVLVTEGMRVAAGQGVVVLEAMKMQNEIQAERDGVVAKILVEPGRAVEGGDPLFELE